MIAASSGPSGFEVLDLCAVPILVVGAKGTVLAWNSRCEQQFKLPSVEVHGRSIWEVRGFHGWRQHFDSSESPAKGCELVAFPPGADVGVRFLVELARSARGAYRVATAVGPDHPPEDAPISSRRDARPRALVEAIGDYAIYQLDPQGRIVSWNTGAHRLTGFQAREVIGRSYAMFFTSEDLQAGKPQGILEIAAMEGRHEEESWRIRRGGHRFWARATTTPIHGDREELIGYAKVVRDMTAERRAEEQQRRLVERLAGDRQLFEAVLRQLPVGVVVRDAGGEVLAFNDAIARNVGPEGPGKESGHALHPDRSPYRAEEMPAVRALSGESFTNEQLIWMTDDGRERVFDVSAQPVGGDSGLIEASVVVYADVTERARIEHALERRERLLRTILEVLPVGLWTVNADGHVDLVNPAARSMWGADLEAQLLSATEPHEPGREWPHHRALRSGEPVPGEILHVDGFRTILHSAVPIHDDDEGVVGAVAVSEDVTALHRAEEGARAALRARNEVVQIVSHDLRNPLNVVSLHTALLVRNEHVLSDGEAAASLKTVARAVRQMQRLVSDLLEAGRIEAGKLSVRLGPQDCAEILVEAIEAARTVNPGRVVRLGSARPLPPALVDKDRILQVLANLVDNAARSTVDGGTIILSARAEADEIVWSVADDGHGIPEEQRAHVFEPFWQGKRKKGALGLGLSISKGIVEAHGGRMWAETSRLGGATISFTTPIAHAEL